MVFSKKSQLDLPAVCSGDQQMYDGREILNDILAVSKIWLAYYLLELHIVHYS